MNKKTKCKTSSGRRLAAPALLVVVSMVAAMLLSTAGCREGGSYADERERAPAALAAPGLGQETEPAPARRAPVLPARTSLTRGAALGDIDAWFDSPLGRKVPTRAN